MIEPKVRLISYTQPSEEVYDEHIETLQDLVDLNLGSLEFLSNVIRYRLSSLTRADTLQRWLTMS